MRVCWDLGLRAEFSSNIIRRKLYLFVHFAEYWQKCTQAPSPSTSLNVNNLIEGRRYDFRVFAVNDAGASEPALIDGYVFTPASKGVAPEIVAPLHDQPGTVGGAATFECEVSGVPKPEIAWFRGSKELVDTSKCTLIDKGAKQVLIVSNLHAEDEDEYTCRATNALGSRSTRAQLKLSSEWAQLSLRRKSDTKNVFLAKPRIFVPPRYNLGVSVEKGNFVELKIPYKAYPAASATWTKNDETRVESGAKYTITTDDKCATLRIANAQRDDSGDYRLVLHNNVGSDSGSVAVHVADVPEPPRFPQIENVLDEAAILSWKPPPTLDGEALVTG